ncbi:GNAT family N-acetyltransferase [Pontibacter sp. BT310]|uniref:GNAT family N-acetyltransferase n=1 Tax=Pontibacter populi TaxID=890055 RepID=A0ABS6XBW9_9BACT|nr:MULTISPECIES: GNAT family protein [Pontibacter]MBJ6118634.1 GNAT family N-acetyltransferase [Pontibacter sp. BT310]MBR0571063.1 GNAT family N-acetyltransferase [Microvirga sp. STS03]MBW3365488.1 GNAT family N-acetyltransferase [Pontibacter populi]
MNFEKDLHLESDCTLLRPLQPHDLEQMQTIALDADTWRWNVTKIANTQDLLNWAHTAFTDRQLKRRYSFVILDKTTGRLAGSTSYGNISEADKRLEIGWTWIGKDFRGTGLNRHCKFLLLSYAFEVLDYERVELKTDVLNVRSRQAMRKIGATEEGVLRSHTLMHDGRRRDTIYYSILKSEWPQIKATIFADLGSYSTHV